MRSIPTPQCATGAPQELQEPRGGFLDRAIPGCGGQTLIIPVIEFHLLPRDCLLGGITEE